MNTDRPAKDATLPSKASPAVTLTDARLAELSDRLVARVEVIFSRRDDNNSIKPNVAEVTTAVRTIFAELREPPDGDITADTPLADLLPLRIGNALELVGIETAGQLAAKLPAIKAGASKDWKVSVHGLHIANIGIGAIAELEAVVSKMTNRVIE
jgi:hypothetical protein